MSYYVFTRERESMMNSKVLIVLLVSVGVYFLLFHVAPFPFNHEAIGLPPYHVLHALFGIVLLASAGYLWKKGGSKKNSSSKY